MQLQLKILNGSRKGHVIRFSSTSRDIEKTPYVLENEALKIIFLPPDGTTRAKLILENSSIELTPQINSDGEIELFYMYPITRDGFQQALFHNYFGIAILYIELTNGDTDDIVEVGRIDVLAKKSSVEQIEAMIEYIIDANEDELLKARGATRRGSDVGYDEGLPPQHLLEHLESNIQIIEEVLPYIIHAPISSLATKNTLIPAHREIDLNDQGIAWLAENLSVLTPSSTYDDALFVWQGQPLQASEVQTSLIFENTDIYENRIILGYLDNLLSFTNELLQGPSNGSFKDIVSLNAHNGYISFFNSVASKLRGASNSQTRRIYELQDQIRIIRATILTKLDISKSDSSLPKFTPKVRSNRQYNALFRSIHKWYKCSTIDWTAQKLLLAIDNIPRLFELYTALLLREWCSKNGTEDDKQDQAFWSGTIEGSVINLFYEPIYWMSGHVKQKGHIRNTENRTLSSASSDYLGKIRHGDYAHRSPDYVIEISPKDKPPTLIVLDAKYTNQKLAFEKYLPDCTLKYVHGLGSTKTPYLTCAMFILYPAPAGQDKFLDFHAAPYDVFGNATQFPMLGAQGLNLGHNNLDHLCGMDKLMRQSFSNILKK